jgi:hypothetical protein
VNTPADLDEQVNKVRDALHALRRTLLARTKPRPTGAGIVVDAVPQSQDRGQQGVF